jgi:hypothetical protein
VHTDEQLLFPHESRFPAGVEAAGCDVKQSE